MSLKYPDGGKSGGFYRIAALFFMAAALLVLTNLPDRESAERLAEALVAKRVAACVNILAPCRSTFRWEGAIQHELEHPLLIKTTAGRYAELEREIRAAHPYELPEIVAVPIERGLPAYLGWVEAETGA
jgi:periplasmic divalent cation tolerance protein